jgi:hypothetical protein
VLMLCTLGTGSRIEGASPPQDREKDWAAVGSLPRGTHVKLAQRSGVSLDGRLEDWSDDAVTVRTKTGNVKAPRATVVRVVRVSGSDRTRRAGWGFLAGAIAGAVQGGALVRSNRGAWITVLSAGWGAVGAAIGAASGGHRESVIYESPGSGAGAVGVNERSTDSRFAGRDSRFVIRGLGDSGIRDCPIGDSGLGISDWG